MERDRKAPTTLNQKDNRLSERVMERHIIFAASIILCVTFFGCAPHQMYREVYSEVCVSMETTPASESKCEKYALQLQLSASNDPSYLLGFIEFDDQGQLWNREQMKGVLSELRKRAIRQEMLIVVFAHGWKHSAAPGDTNINTFRKVLTQLNNAEVHREATSGKPARQVAGIYLGWRGGSVSWWGLKELTFWDRKNTAQKVGYGGVAEVLSQLEEIRATSEPGSRIVVVGHSFGGAVVHTALVQILENRFIQTTASPGHESTAHRCIQPTYSAGQVSNANRCVQPADSAGEVPIIQGFGNLVVLINPAIEANLFAALSDMSVERSCYHRSQLPVMAVLTSKADWATSIAFPIGRWFSTRFENEHDRQRCNAVTDRWETISQHDANITAVGHFEPYRTHKLELSPQQRERKREGLKPLSTKESVETFRTISRPSWENDQPGSVITYDDVILTRTHNSAGHNPYLMIYVDQELITDHNDIDDERVIEFIKQLIMVSSDKQK